MGHDPILIQLLILLAASLVVGTIAERLKQSALVGYLLAGMLVGPNVLGIIGETEGLEDIAELGVALLLFTIGLEFSFQRLLKLGRVALLGGTLQVLVTTIVTMAAWMIFGISPRAALTLGAMAAMSSTACVLRVLTDRAALESVYGRNSVGILLLQDVMVIPFTLIVSAIALPSGGESAWIGIGRTLLFGTLLVGGFILLFNVIVPRLLNIKEWSTNRELPVLLAIIMSVGAAWAAGEAGLNPAIGAFLAGVLLAASPFAVQIQADVGPAKTVLVTIFFASVGLLADPVWAASHALQVVPTFIAVIVGKAVIVMFILRLLGVPLGMALASGLCVSQVGEFSFVLGQIGVDGGLFDESINKLTIAATTLTLLVTPYLIKIAPTIADRVETFRGAVGATADLKDEPENQGDGLDRVLLIGFGPAGQRVAEALLGFVGPAVHVLELNPRNAARAADYGLSAHIGDARQATVLEHVGIRRCFAVVITLPDPGSARQIIHLIRSINPNATIVARSRYHVSRWELQMAGALVVDEEEQVGLVMAGDVINAMRQAGRIKDDSHPSTAEIGFVHFPP